MKVDFDGFRDRTSNNFKTLFDDNVPRETQDKIDVSFFLKTYSYEEIFFRRK